MPARDSDSDPAPIRRTVRRLQGALVLLAIGAALPCPAAARPTSIGLTLECVNVRRLSDNFLLDLRIRLQFDPARTRYARFENTGRGWQLVGTHAVAGQTPTRIVLVWPATWPMRTEVAALAMPGMPWCSASQ